MIIKSNNKLKISDYL